MSCSTAISFEETKNAAEKENLQRIDSIKRRNFEIVKPVPLHVKRKRSPSFGRAEQQPAKDESAPHSGSDYATFDQQNNYIISINGGQIKRSRPSINTKRLFNYCDESSNDSIDQTARISSDEGLEDFDDYDDKEDSDGNGSDFFEDLLDDEDEDSGDLRSGSHRDSGFAEKIDIELIELN